MRARLLIILALVCAVIATSVTGTLSAHSVTSGYVASILPDTDKILGAQGSKTVSAQTQNPLTDIAGSGTTETASETTGS